MASLAQKQIDRLDRKMEKLAKHLAGGGVGHNLVDILIQMGRYKELGDERNVWMTYQKKTETNTESSMSELPDDYEDEPELVETDVEPVPRRMPRRQARGWGG